MCAEELLEKALNRGELSAERVSALLERYLRTQDPAVAAAAAAATGATSTAGGSTTGGATATGGATRLTGAAAVTPGSTNGTTGFGAGHSGYVT